jgi:hypothetical protein
MTGDAYLFNEIRMNLKAYRPMTRLFRISFFLTAVGAVATACASSWPAQRIEIMPGSVTGDSALEGGFRWTMLDGKPAPVEFPVNSGRRLVYGTLDLRNVAAARAGTGGTYSMRFTVQPVNDTVQTTGNDGQFTLRADTAVLTPAGQAFPITFRLSWRPTGELTLTDGANHVWVYARR